MDLGQIMNSQSKSHFLSLEKDLKTILWKLIENDKLTKLLHYPTRDALARESLSMEDRVAMIHDNIKIVPKLPVDEEEKSYIIISFDGFVMNKKNPQFRDCILIFDIVCYTDSWPLDNYQVRPFKIMGEIDSMFKGARLDGIGQVEFEGADRLLLNNVFSGFSVRYRLINDI